MQVAETLVESKPQKNFRKELQMKAAKEAASQGVSQSIWQLWLQCLIPNVAGDHGRSQDLPLCRW